MSVIILACIVIALAVCNIVLGRLNSRYTTKLLELHKQRQHVSAVLDAAAGATVPVADVREALNVKLA